MNIWKILQIEKTKDQELIKKAYANAVKNCHPEENPQGFMELKKAYKAALSYAKEDNASEEGVSQSYHSLNQESLLEKTNDNTLLSTLEKTEKEKQEDQKASPALEEFVKLFENEEKSDDNNAWREYVESELFWNEMYEQYFMEEIHKYLHSQKRVPMDKLPKAMVREFAIAYTPTIDSKTLRVCVCPEDFSNPVVLEYSKITEMEEFMAPLWNCRSDMKENFEYKQERLSINRSRAFGCLKSIYRIAKEESWDKKDSYMEKYKYDLSMGREVFLMRDDQAICSKMSKSELSDDHINVIFLKMVNFLLRKFNFPIEVCSYMYKDFKLAQLEQSEYREEYLPILEYILKLYPNIDEYANANITCDEYDKKLRYVLREFEGKYARGGSCQHNSGVAIEIVEGNDEETEEMEKIFASSLFQKYKYEDAIRNQFLHPKTIRQAQAILKEYSKDNPTEHDGVVRIILESLRTIRYHNAVRERLWNYNYEYSFGLDQLEFWHYFFDVAFGDRVARVKENMKPAGVMYGPYITMHSFIKNNIYTSIEWRRRFLNYDLREGRFGENRCLSIQMNDSLTIRIEFHYHYVRFFENDKEILYPCFEAGNVLEMFPEEDDDVLFLLLLPICYFTKDDAQESYDRLMRILPGLLGNFYAAYFIADQILNDNATMYYSDSIVSRKYIENLDVCYRLDTDKEGKRYLWKFNERLGMYENMDIQNIGEHYRGYVFFGEDQDDEEGYDMDSFDESMIELEYRKDVSITSLKGMNEFEKVTKLFEIAKDKEEVILAYGDADRLPLRFRFSLHDISTKELLDKEMKAFRYLDLYVNRMSDVVDEPYEFVYAVSYEGKDSSYPIAKGKSGDYYLKNQFGEDVLRKEKVEELMMECIDFQYVTDIIEYSVEKRSQWEF